MTRTAHRPSWRPGRYGAAGSRHRRGVVFRRLSTRDDSGPAADRFEVSGEGSKWTIPHRTARGVWEAWQTARRTAAGPPRGGVTAARLVETASTRPTGLGRRRAARDPCSFVVGLEPVTEFVTGKLGNPAPPLIPIATATAGVIVPALLYLAATWTVAGASRGWAIPAATDIAFAVAVLAVAGRFLPPALRLSCSPLLSGRPAAPAPSPATRRIHRSCRRPTPLALPPGCRPAR